MRGPLSAERVYVPRLAMKPPASPSLIENASNERQLFARLASADFVAGSDQVLRLGQLSVAIVMNCDKRFAFFYTVADALMEFEPDGMVDGVFLFFAAAAKRRKSSAKLFAIRPGDKAR